MSDNHQEHEHFPTIKDDNAMVGSSMGGIITSYAGIKYADIFKKTASLSTAYWFYVDEFCDINIHNRITFITCLIIIRNINHNFSHSS